jgi:hypothetical protein
MTSRKRFIALALDGQQPKGTLFKTYLQQIMGLSITWIGMTYSKILKFAEKTYEGQTLAYFLGVSVMK